ncbi:type II toxin-antitoxin system Phd/YefM family antitoxin [Microbacterium elymi]|uniref:Type II toxin-antitoxin system prevent-host-death family antitoxin n=1 Tax=Microbacterium elymi TaxID=2909587 RepID=A0ABY5NNG8_9MICO|nr:MULTISPECIES: type II toxin-antitoxin system prevent-host-death family antitoxin [Microbacterium]UUT36624.1 type II toxin-antitoxin system prevent-host-death family antitoxin [Microbacterium elymi]
MSRTELNQQTARVLARVVAGERITITDRGRPIAELTPPLRSRWDELVAAGKIIPARVPGGVTVVGGGVDASTEEIIADIRADRS